MKTHELNFNGIFPPLTTPFDAEGNVDYEGLKQNIAQYNDTGLRGYVALGSNGEAVHLSADERVRVIETIKQSATSSHTIIAGVNEFSTRAAIDSARRVADAGADAALVITPYFYKSHMTSSALADHFTAVADNSPIPVLVYNVPQNTGVVIDSATIAALGEHQNISGVKDSSGNFGAIAETISRAPQGFQVMTGNGAILYPSLLMNAVGAILAIACAAPHVCVDLYDAVQSGDHAKARELQTRIAPLSHIVTAGLGVAALKAAMDINGYIGGRVRAPLAQLSENDKERVRDVMRKTGLFPEIE
ncbi:MAG TPA: dihydrodipicolinate synthase family protein [Blastocatellia bacterium]|nr:dihydrodipicolinate synthase family protein [Blastocatellia bacterium]